MAFNKIFWAQKCSYNGKWLYYIDRSVYISHKREEKTLFTQFFLFKFCIEWTKYVRSIDERSTRYVNEKKIDCIEINTCITSITLLFSRSTFLLVFVVQKKAKRVKWMKICGKIYRKNCRISSKTVWNERWGWWREKNKNKTELMTNFFAQQVLRTHFTNGLNYTWSNRGFYFLILGFITELCIKASHTPSVPFISTLSF